MKFVVTADGQELFKTTTDAERTIAKAVTAAMFEAGKQAAAAATAQVRAAGFASAKWEIRAKDFGANTLRPEVWIHSRSNFEDVFDQGKQIIGNPFLWLPLPDVPLWPGDPTRQMSPKKFTQTVGPLQLIKRKGKPPLLAAVVIGASTGKPLTLRRLRKHLGTGSRMLVPMFVGIPAVQIEKRFDVESAVERIAEKVPGLYVENENK